MTHMDFCKDKKKNIVEMTHMDFCKEPPEIRPWLQSLLRLIDRLMKSENYNLSLESRLTLFERNLFLQPHIAETKMSQKNNQKVACNMSNLPPILVSIFSFLVLPTGSPLMKLGQI